MAWRQSGEAEQRSRTELARESMSMPSVRLRLASRTEQLNLTSVTVEQATMRAALDQELTILMGLKSQVVGARRLRWMGVQSSYWRS